MKHTAFLIWLIAACVIALPAKGLASYLIKLKNGSQYVTYDYWEEGNQIKFKISGGEIGFSKDSVLRITETDLPVETEIVTPETPSTEADLTPEAATPSDLSDSTETKPLPQADTKPEGPSAQEKEALLAEKNALLEKLQTAKQDFNKAKAQGSQEDIERKRKNLLDLHRQRDQLRQKAADSSSGAIPAWWGVDGISSGILTE